MWSIFYLIRVHNGLSLCLQAEIAIMLHFSLIFEKVYVYNNKYESNRGKMDKSIWGKGTRINPRSTIFLSFFFRLKCCAYSFFLPLICFIYKNKEYNLIMPKKFIHFLEGNNVYACSECSTHLASLSDLISKAFVGKSGRAFLFNSMYELSYSELISG